MSWHPGMVWLPPPPALPTATPSFWRFLWGWVFVWCGGERLAFLHCSCFLEPFRDKAPSGRAGLRFSPWEHWASGRPWVSASSFGRGLAAGRAALSCKRKLCRPSSCLEPGAWAFWLLRGPWPAKSEKGARFFPLLQPAAIVEKVNTPHSLTGKPSSQEWEEIKSLFQPRPWRAHKGWSVLLGPCWEHRNNTRFWSRINIPLAGPFSLWGFSPVAKPPAPFCLGAI